MVSTNVSDATIAEYLDKNPAVFNEARIAPGLSVNTIITAKSQPLPDFGFDPTSINLLVKLADYVEGGRLDEYLHTSWTDSTKLFP